MATNWIDRLARRLAAPVTTRRMLARLGAAGVLVAALGIKADEVVGACRRPKKECTRASQCCSGRCRRGKCTKCRGGLKFCGGACVDTQTDLAHCGECGNDCDDGQACQGGTCICSQATCGGCCAGTTCRDGNDDDFCGEDGEECFACPEDQECLEGRCLCTPNSCPNGCCEFGTQICQEGTSDELCGANGNHCSPCFPGEHCVNGLCVCDGTSCDGCCLNDHCFPGEFDAACGANGATCDTCTGGEHCIEGTCV